MIAVPSLLVEDSSSDLLLVRDPRPKGHGLTSACETVGDVAMKISNEAGTTWRKSRGSI